MNLKLTLKLISVCFLTSGPCLAALAQGTAFVYQGSLGVNGTPANGAYDITFIVYDSTNLPGHVVAGPLTNSATTVSNGFFQATLDFGPGVFNGAPSWLELGVRTNGAVMAFTTLSPRQPVLPVPYAVMAGAASNLLGTLPATQLSGMLPAAALAGSYSGAIALNNFANSFSGNGGGLTNVNAAAVGGLAPSNFWQTGGNSGATPGINFLGTTDNQPLELWAGKARSLRLEPDPSGAGAPNVIGGSAVNAVAAGVLGATIGGGGETNGYGGYASSNSVTGNFGVVAGGFANTASVFATVSGGDGNTATNEEATVSGGGANTASGGEATVGGGDVNTASGYAATVGGGEFNTASGYKATVPGGGANLATGKYSLAAGQGAKATNDGSFVWADGETAPFGSTTTNQFSVRANGGVVFVTSGAGLTVDAQPVVTGSGLRLEPDPSGAGAPNVIGGSAVNAVAAGVLGATIGGGGETNGYGGYASSNSVTGNFGVVAGGFANTASVFATVSGGDGNTATNEEATVSGGGANTASGGEATVGGGDVNTASGYAATVGGGEFNTASGYKATVPGGGANLATGKYSLAAGQGAQATNDGSFVWADGQSGPFASTASNQFSVRANGGVVFVTSGAGLTVDGNPVLSVGGNVNLGTVTATSFTGNGAGLTDIGAASLPTNVALLNGPASFSGTVAASGFTGNGAGLSNVFLGALNAGGALTWGNFVLDSTPGAGTTPYAVAAADVNGDGRLDLICVGGGPFGAGTLAVLTNNGRGGFVIASKINVGVYPQAVVAADVNGDGKVDLICANAGFMQPGHTLTVLTNDGSGNFALSANLQVGNGPYSIAVSDVNGDGYVDLICANSRDNTLTVLTNDGHGGFVTASTPAVGNTPYSLTAGDVNGDGFPDLICANYSDSTVTVLINDHNGGFVRTDYNTGAYPRSVAAADVNGDGYLDLITANTADNTLAVLLNDGSGHFTLSATLSVGRTPSAVVAADVNGDARMDLISVNKLDNTMTVLTNDGSGNFAVSATLIVGNNPLSAVAADLNGDSRMDLVSANQGDNTLSVWFNSPAFNGMFTGSGAGLTNINAASLTGALPAGSVGNAQLANNWITVNAGTGLTGGGTVALGGTITLNATGGGGGGLISVTGNGDITATNLGGTVTLGDTATSTNIPGTIVKRDANGNFSAGGIIANNLNLPVTTVSGGIIYSGAVTLLHAYGPDNLFAGPRAGNLTMSGAANTGVGGLALFNNTSGNFNTANGASALFANTNGSQNTASGYRALGSNTSGNVNTASGSQALQANTSGGGNTAIGFQAIQYNTTGSFNTASGHSALQYNTTGNNNTASGSLALENLGQIGGAGGTNNIALGYQAGASFTGNESGNIDIGNSGALGDNNTIRIGTPGIHTNTVLAGAVTATSFTGNGAVSWQVPAGTTVQAVANTGYLLNSTQPMTLTLPASPNPGDIVRVSSAGIGGWSITQNSGQSILAPNFTLTSAPTLNWSLAASAPSQSWRSIAASASGNQFVAAFNGLIYMSTDSAATWVATSATNANWVSVASSADGTVLAAAATAGSPGIYLSTDSGANWAPIGNWPNVQFWNNVALSADGTTLAAVEGIGIAGPGRNNGSHYVHTLSNLKGQVVQHNGNVYSGPLNQPTFMEVEAVSLSADGSRLIVAGQWGSGSGAVAVSLDAGVSWSIVGVAGGYDFYSLASSSDGLKLAVAGLGIGGGIDTPPPGPIYTSRDGGITWTQTSAPSTYWFSIASSADGTKLAAVTAYDSSQADPGSIFTSSDAGATWTSNNVPNQYWSSVASSADGNILAATVGGRGPGQIYYLQAGSQITTTPGAPGRLQGGQNTAVELQYVGNGQFMPLSHEGTIFAY